MRLKAKCEQPIMHQKSFIFTIAVVHSLHVLYAQGLYYTPESTLKLYL